MKKKNYVLKSGGVIGIVALIMAGCSPALSESMEKDLERVDEALNMMEEYIAVKEQKINALHDMLSAGEPTLRQKWGIYGSLYEEYAPYQFDKAIEMLKIQEEIADSLHDSSLRTTTLLNKAFILTTSGMYLEASTIFSELDTISFNYSQKMLWYNARQKFLTDYGEYLKASGMKLPEAEKAREYQDIILKNTPENSSINSHIRILRLINDRNFRDAYDENLRIIRSLNSETRDYAVQTYWQGFICENLSLEEEAVKWWAESAICDIKGAIKDNASLCSIAIKLTGINDPDRAFRYIRLSLDDALFYNAKLRKVQIASTLPWIEKTYLDAMTQKSREKNTYLVLISAFAVLLLLLAIVATRLQSKQRKHAGIIELQNTRLAESNVEIAKVEDDLRKINMELTEANTAKEEYLGLFLSMCSGYLDKLRKTITREQYEAELKNFYKTFDTSFLTLYPTFVEDFNALLNDDGKVVLKQGELLNTELRIFALIKLGITQSSHIASLLRYSVNTIYNYRAQVKNAALSDRENFEENVRKISFRK